jgi:hypothetical protein
MGQKIELQHEVLDDLMLDPVFAAEALMGLKLDTFQQAALKLDWYFPMTIDSSGTGTGKTLRMFALACLRAILCCNATHTQWVGCYFPTWGQVGKQEFWQYFYKFLKTAPSIFRDQFAVHRRKIHEEKGAACWTMYFQNGSKIEMPAPNFMKDAETQAGRSFNTLLVDEWLKCTGSGIDSQLIERARRPAWNAEHPFWCNHIHLKGHAQTPGHKGYQRYQAYRKAAKDGDPSYMVYSFCYQDFSENFKHVVNWKIVRNQKVSLSKDEFSRQLLGLWARGGATYYPEAVIARGARMELLPCADRRDWAKDDIAVMGVDVAPGQTVTADYAAITIWRLRRVPLHELKRMADVNGPRFVKIGRQVFEIRVAYSWKGHNMGATEMSGLIHALNMRFHCAKIVMDPGGGGLYVKSELIKKEQVIPGKGRVTVVPICTMHEGITSDKLPILAMFKMEGEFEYLDMVKDAKGVDGFLAAFHFRYAQRWNRAEINFPTPLSRRNNREVQREWNGEQLRIQKCIDEQFAQLPKVRQLTNEEGQPLISRNGCSLFGSKDKKDLAYSGLYALAAAELVFQEIETGSFGGDTDVYCEAA